jgi:hypothetical protein
MDTGGLKSESAITQLDVDRLVRRLDRVDILLLRQFYVTGQPYPNDTTPYVLKILVRDYQANYSSGRKHLSYHAVRKRLENLRALGLLGKIPKTNPAVYFPVDHIANDVKRLILKFAAELVGFGMNLRK